MGAVNGFVSRVLTAVAFVAAVVVWSAPALASGTIVAGVDWSFRAPVERSSTTRILSKEAP